MDSKPFFMKLTKYDLSLNWSCGYFSAVWK